LLCVCVLCVGSGLATSRSPVQGVLPTAYRIRKAEKEAKALRGEKRAVEPNNNNNNNNNNNKCHEDVKEIEVQLHVFLASSSPVKEPTVVIV
jgi:hypothetical protein